MQKRTKVTLFWFLALGGALIWQTYEAWHQRQFIKTLSAAFYDNGPAQYKIGRQLETGTGPLRRWNPFASAWFYRRAAAREQGMALARLGWLHFTGVGAKQDYRRAVGFLREATAHRLPEAYTLLGRALYADANHHKEARLYLRVGAELGDPEALLQLAIHPVYPKIEFDKLPSQDRINRFKWLLLAAENGAIGAKGSVAMFKEYMSGHELDAARRLALQWKQRHRRQ